MTALSGARIVFVLAGEVLGGAERGALDLAELFREQGAGVSVVALDDRPGRGRQVAAERGVPWTSAPVSWAGGRVAKAAGLLRLTRTLRALRPDAVVAGTNLPNVVCGLTWRMSGARTAVWRQCDVNGTSRFRPSLFRRSLQATPVVVTAAEHGRTWLASEYRIDPSRITVVSSPVRLPPARETGTAWRGRLGIAEGAFVGCMLAHLHVGKDHATLLRAWRTVANELGDGRATLVLAGRDAGAEAASKALAFDLDLRQNVRFAGEVEDVAGLLAACDLAVLCSHRELLPRGVSEPMSAGLPVVATDLPGTREALGTAAPGALVAPSDPAALAEAILRFARDAELRRRVGTANAATVVERNRRAEPELAWTRIVVDALGDGA